MAMVKSADLHEKVKLCNLSNSRSAVYVPAGCIVYIYNLKALYGVNTHVCYMSRHPLMLELTGRMSKSDVLTTSSQTTTRV